MADTDAAPVAQEAVELAQLALRIAAGASTGEGKDAETQLCRAFAPRIRLFGLRRLRDPQAANDFTHEVLIIVLEALRAGRVDKPARIAAFTLSTCRMVAIDWRRNQRRRDGLFARYVQDLLPRFEPLQPDLDRARLGQCLDALPPREYRVICDCFKLDKAIEQIAAVLQTSAGNVRVLRHRAIARLRRCMAEPGSAP